MLIILNNINNRYIQQQSTTKIANIQAIQIIIKAI